VNFENTRGETPLESCAFAVVEQARALGVRMRTLAFFAGRTSSAYSDLKKGTLAYSNMITGVTRAKALADARGWKLVVLGALVKHGESDAASTTYQAELNQWQADVETDVRAITGQTA
ncbi:hypothetical protein EGN72_00225, partial [Pseudorhodobacter sp. E13]|uniref:hypothetical protein n=1 Tax=Pseudorhodobacter sp. E13 TaxID=2487931 RepID=UPI000FA28CE8